MPLSTPLLPRFHRLRAILVFVALAALISTPTSALGGRGSQADARGTVWHDLDRNGVQGAAEPGIQGVTLRLIRTSDQAILEAVITASDGSYISAGSYSDVLQVEIVLPSGLILTLQDQGAEDIDSDFDRATARTTSFDGSVVVDAGLAAPELATLDIGVAFGDVAEGETLSLPVEIRNVESHPMTLTSLSPGGGTIALSAGNCAPLPRVLTPDETCLANASFDSTSPGSMTGVGLGAGTEWNLAPVLIGFADGTSVAPIYVDPALPPGGGGTSWADAYSSLESALAVAGAYDHVWIADGVIRPAATLVVPGRVFLTGSFSGGEIATSQRDLSDGPTTVLSADTDGDDLDGNSDGVVLDADDIVGTNLDQLMESDNWIELDGLSLTAADGVDDGLALNAPGFEIRRCRITGHRGPSALAGGSAQVVIEASSFEGNDAVALFVDVGSQAAVIDSSTFRGNRTNGGGAAIRATGQTIGLQVRSTLFAGNRSEGAGGAIRFEADSGTRGSAVLLVERSTFAGNTAGTLGGAISADQPGAASVVRESIFWANRDDLGDASTWAVDVTGGPDVMFETSDVEGSGGSGAWDTDFGLDGGGNLDVDPELVHLPSGATAPFADGDFRLWASSPLLDLGATDPTEMVDAAGANRVDGAATDLGALEGGVAGLRGRVWHDVDEDGIQDEGEPGVEGVTVSVLLSGRGNSFPTMTDPAGRWHVADLAAGNWKVVVDRPAGFVAFSPADVGSEDTDSDVGSGGTLDNLDSDLAPKVDAGLVEGLFADGFESGDTTAWSSP